MATTPARTTKKPHAATVTTAGTFFRAAGSPGFFAPTAKKPSARAGARPGIRTGAPIARPTAAGPEKVAPRTTDAALRRQPPVRPKPVRPQDDPAFTRVTGTVTATARQKRAHPPATTKAAEAQAAALPPSGDIDAQAKVAKAETMEAQQPGTFDKKAFIAAVKAAIEAKSPKTLEEAADVRSGKAGEVKGEVKGLVTQGKKDQTADIHAATHAPPDRSKATPKPVIPMGPEPAGRAPRIPAAGAVPKPAPPEQLNLAAGKHEADREMAEADVSDTQLAESNEPQFQQALTDKKTAAAHADTAPAEYREQEAQVLGQGKEEAGAVTGAGVAGMQGTRVGALAKLVAQKTRTKSADETRRAQVTAEIEKIFTATESAVKAILDGIDPKVEKEFNEGEAFARSSFETFVAAKMAAYKRDRYGGVFGGARWASDKLFGMPDAVNRFYVDGRALYLREMDRTITRIANIVGDDLTAAKTRITKGRNDIAVYVKGLPKDLKKVGADAAKEIGSRFSELESTVDAKATALVDTLATKYVAARKGLDERIEALQAANKGLVDKAIGAIKAVIRTIREFISTMKNVLVRAAGVVGQIIKAPGKFLRTLIAGVKGGILKFKADFLGHLRRGLLSWLFGEVAETGIELPKSFDLKGIIGFLASILGLTWANIRSRIVKRIGEKAMGAVEKGVQIFSIIAKEGLGGVWNLLLEKLGDVKEMIFAQVKDFVKERIIAAGITWLIGMLNPVAAFIKACKLIIDIVMFFVRNAARIAKFVNTIIDSVADMVRGNVAGVVNKINDALGQMVPLIIGFLASLIGLGGIGQKVREIIQKLQKPMNAAIDFVIDKGLTLAGPIIRAVTGISASVGAKVAAGKEWVQDKAQAAKRKFTGTNGTTPAAPSPAPAPAPSHDPESGPLRARVLAALQDEAERGLDTQGMTQAVRGVESRFRPMGLKRLTTSAPNADGLVTVSAEASPFLPLAAFLPRGTVPAGRSETLIAELRLSAPASVTSGAIEAVDKDGNPLPRDQLDVKVRRRGAGAVLAQPTPTVVRATTWNTANLHTYDNVSHAEHHFISWLSGQADLLPLVTSIHLNLRPYSPCARCTGELGVLLSLLAEKRGYPFTRSGRDAVLTWSKPYPGVGGINATTAAGVRKLEGLGWTVHAPAPAEGDPLRNTWIIITPPGYRPPA